MKRDFNYSLVRIVCQGTIKGCDFCKDVKEIHEGYCSQCGRPMYKKIGSPCNFILGYKDNNSKLKGNIHIKCKYCNTTTTI